MAFPVVVTKATGGTTGTSSSATTHSITLPSGVTAGDLLVVLLTVNYAPTISTSSSGWVELGRISNGTNLTSVVYYKVATGSNALTVNTGAVTSQTISSSHISWRITGSSGVVEGTSFNMGSPATTYDPPLHTPSGGAKDYLWIVGVGLDQNPGSTITVSSLPTGFTNQSTANGITLNTNNVRTYSGEQNLNAASLDPGTGNVTTSGAAPSGEQTVIWTLSIEPDSAPQLFTLGLITGSAATLNKLTKSYTLGSITGSSTINAIKAIKTKTFDAITGSATLNALKATKYATLGEITEIGTVNAIKVTRPVSLGEVTGSSTIFEIFFTSDKIVLTIESTGTLFPLSRHYTLGSITSSAATINALSVSKRHTLPNITGASTLFNFQKTLILDLITSGSTVNHILFDRSFELPLIIAGDSELFDLRTLILDLPNLIYGLAVTANTSSATVTTTNHSSGEVGTENELLRGDVEVVAIAGDVQSSGIFAEAAAVVSHGGTVTTETIHGAV